MNLTLSKNTDQFVVHIPQFEFVGCFLTMSQSFAFWAGIPQKWCVLLIASYQGVQDVNMPYDWWRRPYKVTTFYFETDKCLVTDTWDHANTLFLFNLLSLILASISGPFLDCKEQLLLRCLTMIFCFLCFPTFIHCNYSVKKRFPSSHIYSFNYLITMD